MNSLSEAFKDLIDKGVRDHIIISDPDRLMEYEEFQSVLTDSGYKILFSGSSIHLRILFELEVRESEEKIIIVAPQQYRALPDIENAAKHINIRLSDLFPNLECDVIIGLDYRTLSVLHRIKLYESLGYEKTIKYLLENVYNLDFDSLSKRHSRERALNALIVVFFNKESVNDPIVNYLTKLFHNHFSDYPVEKLSREYLKGILNKLWSEFVSVADCDVDFTDPVLNKNFAFLFLIDELDRVMVTDSIRARIPESLQVGVKTDKVRSINDEFRSYIQAIEERVHLLEDSYADWFNLMPLISKAKLMQFKCEDQTLIEKSSMLEKTINARFQRFVENVYWSLFTLSGIKRPVVVSRILDYAYAREEKRKALIVIDGMNYWQSMILAAQFQKSNIHFNIQATLAFIPTITAWSRQGIFRGGKPDIELDNSKEHKFFAEYWISRGYNPSQIKFMNLSLNNQEDIKSLRGSEDILGIVINDLDSIMHGTILGNNQLRSSTEHWVQSSGIIDRIIKLKKMDYKIFITSDHGNVSANGVKNLKLAEKVGAVSRSKRHLLFANDTLRKSFTDNNPDLEFGIRGNSVYLKNEEAFTSPGENVVTHGGSHFWETIIPFMEIE